ncbi:right-handed parallel beta-helix repeat-containing protein [Candidatus Fermentibacteria bacterium]|nr:right-handed parallel beta-helix repeat-containing protein [Candidatus Fermentibacteria bacterium]
MKSPTGRTSGARPAFLLACHVVISPLLMAGDLWAMVYQVGPGQPYASIGAVPWESLAAGDSVVIHWRSEPYREKWVLCRTGTADSPIVVRGLPSPEGERPVVSGENAVTRPQLDYWNRDRGVVKIGGASVPPDCMPAHITIEGLRIRSARPPYTYDGGSAYSSSASAIYVEKGEHLTFRDCVFDDCGNGLFTAYQSAVVLVDRCAIFGNGIEGSIYQHNSYCESQGITYQFTHYGPLRAGCPGNNLKDRSSGCVIRYNWIEGGNRQLDLVDSDHSALYSDPAYRTTFAYGNILIEPDGAGNSQICHYGGDSGATSRYRKGTLYFYSNTVVSTRTGNTTLFRLSTNEESCDCRNSVAFVSATGPHLAMLDATGVLYLYHDWFKTGWVTCHGTLQGTVHDMGGIVTGPVPGFADEGAQEFWPTPASACVDAGANLADPCVPDHTVELEYVKHSTYKARALAAPVDIGAYESPHEGGIPASVSGVSAREEGMAVILTWEAVTTDTCGLPLVPDAYRVYTATRAYFVPGSELLLTTTADTTTTAPGAAQDPLWDHFFCVTATRAGVEGAASEAVGAFDFVMGPR